MKWDEFEKLFVRYKEIYEADAVQRQAEEDERYRLLGEELERHPIFNPTRVLLRRPVIDNSGYNR